MKTVEAGRARRDRRDVGIQDRTYERKCPQCGKTFLCYNATEWCYRMGEKIFCSWTCYRERERKVPPHTGAGRTAVQEEPETAKRSYFKAAESEGQTREILRRLSVGQTREQIDQELGLTIYVIANRLSRYGPDLGWQPKTKKEAGMMGVASRREKRKGKAPGGSGAEE